MTAEPGAHDALAQEARSTVAAAVLRLEQTTGAQTVSSRPWPGAAVREEHAEPGAGLRASIALECAARAQVLATPGGAREAGMSWEQVGEVLGLAEIARTPGRALGETAWEYAADRSAFRTAQFGAFTWTCPECGETVSDREPSGRNPTEDKAGHGEGCQRLAAAVAE